MVIDRSGAYIDSIFTGYGRPHHWNADHTTREFGKAGISFAMAAHNQSGSFEFVECMTDQPLFLLFAYFSCLRDFQTPPPPRLFFGYIEVQAYW